MKQRIEIHQSDASDPDAVMLFRARNDAMHFFYPQKGSAGFSAGELSEPQAIILLAYLSFAPVGCCALHLEKDYSELKKLFVLPNMRGRGIAEELLQGIEDIARAHQSRKVMLESGALLSGAHRLYLRMGYKKRQVFGAHKNLPESLFFEKAIPV